MRRIDFTFTSDAQGYMIQYKGQNIGGAGILGKYSGRKRAEQVREYASNAQDSINALIAGRGEQRFLDAIAKINNKA